MLLEIFVAPEGCPSCGKAETIVERIAKDYPDVIVRRIHIMEAPDRVAAYGVFSTPFIVMNGVVEFVGVPREADLRARIAARTAAD
jgi:small redox-active disulfide protein 1